MTSRIPYLPRMVTLRSETSLVSSISVFSKRGTLSLLGHYEVRSLLL